MMDTLNKILDFILSAEGKLLIVAIASLISGSQYGKHFKISSKLVEKTLDTATKFKEPGKPLDTKVIAKEIQRDIRKSIFK